MLEERIGAVIKKFVAVFLLLLSGAFAAAASPANDENELLRQEVKALREEIVNFRKDFLYLVIKLFGPQAERELGEGYPREDASKRSAAMAAHDIISHLRTMKAAAIMFIVDNNDIAYNVRALAEKVNEDPQAVKNLLGSYMDTLKAFEGRSLFRVREDGMCLVGINVSSEEDEVKAQLVKRSDRVGLVDANLNLWTSGDVVYMAFRGLGK